MGQTASKAREAHAQAKSKPKNSRGVQQQKLRSARATGVLALPDSKLRKLPGELLELTALRTLDLSGNRLTALPPELARLTALRTLKAPSNALASLPDLSALTALSTLVLDGNALEELPEALPPNLTKLSLRGNKLRGVPASVLALTQLQELDLSENAVTSLPGDLTSWKELRVLKLDDNALESLPAALGACPKLQEVSARRNALAGSSRGAVEQAIDVEVLAEGSNIQVLNLEGNAMNKEDLQAMDGFEAFMQRRTQLKNKELHGGLASDLSICGLD